MDQAVAARLRAVRVERKIPRKALARVLAVTAQQVDKYEQGEDRLSISRLLKICSVLEISAADVVPGFAVTGVSAKEQAKELRLLWLFRSMAPDFRDVFLDLCERIAATSELVNRYPPKETPK